MLKLSVKARGANEKNSVLRALGLIPAVFYGPKQESTSVSVSEKEFEKVFGVAGESSVISLETANGAQDALIHAVDRDPVSGRARHADFYIIEQGKKVEVSVPLVFEGIAPAAKELGANLVKVMHELYISAFPKDLPAEIAVDLTTLKEIGSQIEVKDIALPNGVEALDKPEEVVVVAEEVAEEAEEEVEAPSMDSIEVEKKGKKPEEETPAE